MLNNTLDDRQRISFYSFLFIIKWDSPPFLYHFWSSQLMIRSQRATTIDPTLRQQRLRSCIHPISQSWQDPQLTKSLESFEGFCDLAGVGRVQQYLTSRRVHEIEDWSSHPLDEEGKAIQAEISERFKVCIVPVPSHVWHKH